MPTLIRDGQRVVHSALGSGPNTVLLVHNLLSQRGSFAEVASHRRAPRGDDQGPRRADPAQRGDAGAVHRARALRDCIAASALLDTDSLELSRTDLQTSTANQWLETASRRAS